MASKAERDKMPHYDGYAGTTAWSVYHPKYGYVAVVAPTKDTAIVTAAKKWGARWQDYEFHSRCDVGKT